MNRPSSETLATVVLLVLVLGAAGVALAISQSAPDAAPPPAASPSSSAAASPRQRPAPAPVDSSPETGLPAPEAPPSVTASACPDLTRHVAFRVLTLNVHGGRGPAGFSIARQAQLIASTGADVALLQEVDRARPRSKGVDMPQALASATGMEVAYGLNVDLGPGRGVSGVATLSRFPITEQVNSYLPSQGGTKQRGLLRTDLDVGGTTVSVFNTHLEPGANPIRLRQMSTALAIMSSSEHPKIVGGDLNAEPGSATLALTRPLLRDAWVDSGEGQANTKPAGNPRIRIDYLLYSEPLRATRTVVLPSLVSDHRGVLSHFVLSVAGDEVCVPVLDGAVGSGGG